MRRLILGSLAAICLPLPILACLNDRDSESIEARELPEVLAAITGRFDRNPPLYYEMRLKRVAEAIEITPLALPLYDDAAVACDRLGRFDEAIGWMDKKRALLGRSDGDSPATREQWYRYYANIGTHWAHRWLKNGADRDRIDEVRTARDFIAKAIAIKPDAHFGREKYQLKALDWIIDPPPVVAHAEFLPTLLDRDPRDLSGDAIEGLCGLIVLGNAWESIDIFHALARALDAFGEPDLAYQARLRCLELVNSGRKSLVPDAPRGEALKAIIKAEGGLRADDIHLAVLKAKYLNGRKLGDDRHRARSAFMLARLREGRHPDTDATFWNEEGRAFALGTRDEDSEPASVIPPFVPNYPRTIVRRVDPWWFAPLTFMAWVGVFSILAGSVGFVLWMRARRSPKPAPVDVDWI